MRPLVLLCGAVDRLARVAALAGVAALMGAMSLTVADIVLRRLFGFALIGTLDLVQLCIMAAAFLAIPYGFVTGGHVGIEMATDRLPPRALALAKTTAALAGFAFMTAVGWFGLEQAVLQHGYGDVSQTVGIPMIYYWLPLLAGTGLSMLATAVLAARFFVVALVGRDPAESERCA
jgi:TRAP-type C4-dicarboxylate transport system permease small subunit